MKKNNDIAHSRSGTTASFRRVWPVPKPVRSVFSSAVVCPPEGRCPSATWRGHWRATVLAMLAALSGVTATASAQQALTARAALGGNDVYVGEPIRFQIQVSGSETPERPDLAALKDFAVEFTGGGTNSRTSMTVINGQVTKNVQLGYIFNYELRATREGRLNIPAIQVKADGRSARTQPLTLVARRPTETGDFKLRLALSKERVFVGEQLVMEAIFYFRSNVSEPRLTIPLLESDAFEVYDLESGNGRQLEVLDGKQFNTMRVRKVIVPKRAGSFPGEPATLSFRGQDGTEIAEDFFGRRVRQAKYRTFVIPSNEVALTVDPLPRDGQPANFAGHVGEFALSVLASPTEVNVGDPITLNISVAGPPLLDPVKLPALDGQESLTRDFKVPAEIEEGTVNGSFKVFTQTVRALRDDVVRVPPIELAYFDTATRSYKVARSEPVPIVVRPTRILTAGDVEGATPLGTVKQEIQSWTRGIAYNYTGADLLATPALGFSGLLAPTRLAFVAGPPVAYLLLWLAVTTVRRRNADPEALRSRRALGMFSQAIGGAGTPEEVLAAFRGFLGDKLSMTSEALTFADVRGSLAAAGVTDDDLAVIKRLFTAGEASRFAGGSGAGETDELRMQAGRLARELDKLLR